MQKEDIAWLAGFFEGEGTVRIAFPNKRDLGHLEISIVNTDREIMEWIYTNLNIGGYLKIQSQKKKQHKRFYRWITASRKAKYFLELIQPYIKRSIVKEKIKVALEYQQIKSNCTKRNYTVSDEYREEMFNYWLYMKHLNSRGVYIE